MTNTTASTKTPKFGAILLILPFLALVLKLASGFLVLVSFVSGICYAIYQIFLLLKKMGEERKQHYKNSLLRLFFESDSTTKVEATFPDTIFSDAIIKIAKNWGFTKADAPEVKTEAEAPAEDKTEAPAEDKTEAAKVAFRVKLK